MRGYLGNSARNRSKGGGGGGGNVGGGGNTGGGNANGNYDERRRHSLSDGFIDANQRRCEGEHNPPHHQRNRGDCYRLYDHREPLKRIAQILLVPVCDGVQHARERAGSLSCAQKACINLRDRAGLAESRIDTAPGAQIWDCIAH